MSSLETTTLWESTLAPRPVDDAARPREALRMALARIQARATELAAEIAATREAEESKVADILHLDDLWITADIIAGPSFGLTPPEAFVLASALLVHDLAMGLATVHGSTDGLKAEKTWLEAVVGMLVQKLGRAPTQAELESPPTEIEHDALAATLRTLHGKQSERLTLAPYVDKNGREHHLIEQTDLRHAYGSTIGRVAHSHFWLATSLGEHFHDTIAAEPGMPAEWTVDAFKVACLLRVADVARIDFGRAPHFWRAARRPAGARREHWVLQEKLREPYVAGGRLIYLADSPFTVEEAPAFWLGMDTLAAVDRELRQVDTLLAETGRPRLAARGVAGVEDPGRLSDFLPVEGWTPVDTRVHVTDIPSLVERLGAARLDESDASMPLRELIQNAACAVRTRRMLEEWESDWGTITVRMGEDHEGHWLEVEDTGTGMPSEVLAAPLLDPASSYWSSLLLRRDPPGLLAKGFRRGGGTGLGPFAVFLWGQRARITTRASETQRKETSVLELYTGGATRPILRPAGEGEALTEAGTRVRVWLRSPPDAPDGIFYRRGHDRIWTLDELCAWLCPTLDVHLDVEDAHGKRTRVVPASDWTTIDGYELLGRTWSPLPEPFERLWPREIPEMAKNLRPLMSSSGDVVGRACIHPTYAGVVAVGGLRSCSLRGISGVLLGRPGATRSAAALPVVERRELSRWASEQAALVKALVQDPAELVLCAQIVRACGGSVGDLPVAEGAAGWMSEQAIAAWKDVPDEVLLVREQGGRGAPWRGRIALESSVLCVRMHLPAMLDARDPRYWPEEEPSGEPWRAVMRTLAGAVFEALARAWGVPLDAVMRATAPSRETRIIGHVDGSPVESFVDVVRRP
ncbi:ATP-binding protein [Polyangium aurulentum]|uniref:HD domain-containing protein n=1 Tax=Polyangium aurulentum TaxID=2567896 RepID=UPI0010AE21A1|nr:ATP-binding protein [Polyangium aurulentum]UQA59384.1 hypothetical protein E8A73_002420 [Polyangium aurulentum]